MALCPVAPSTKEGEGLRRLRHEEDVQQYPKGMRRFYLLMQVWIEANSVHRLRCFLALGVTIVRSGGLGVLVGSMEGQAGGAERLRAQVTSLNVF